MLLIEELIFEAETSDPRALTLKYERSSAYLVGG